MRYVMIAAALAAPAPALAGTWVMEAAECARCEVRYDQGTPTVSIHGEKGAVQITPLAFDAGGASFMAVALNKGEGQVNFGIENVAMATSLGAVKLYTKTELVKRAESAAMWANIALAVAGGVAAYGAANTHNKYTTTMYTPRGTYRSVTRYNSGLGDAAAVASIGAAAYGINEVNQTLDQTRRQLAEEILQVTTVDPGDSYGGKVVAEKAKGLKGKGPHDVTVTVSFAGEQYPFAFRLVKR